MIGKKSALLKKMKKQRYLLLMVIPGMIWLLVFCYFPMWGCQIAFQNYRITDAIGSSEFVGLKWFIRFFQDNNFWTVMKNTLGISFLKLAFGFTLPIVFALLLNEIRNVKFKRVVQTISYLPHFLSWVILGGIMITWLSDTGLLNDVFLALGLIDERTAFLAKPQYFWAISVISEVWKELGWGAIIYLAAIAGIDPTQYEAAEIDGANRFQKLWNITLPEISSTIAILFILQVGNIMGSNFDQIFVLNNALNDPASNVIDMFVYKQGITRANYSYATAIGLFRSVISLLLLVIANKVTEKLEGDALF
ncbi:MAG TPA: ABC transporter permease subunit [Candidatus Eisenbergiella merdigallinarum]|uniref:ABC transporter permease subunit n=1 Tax=Candidatus Eisenbergiella merdigallinarum TaxID=2838552 RepID=A0A9D2MV99_9FIRM|nr:ABC transporter permease subunit [Candidatus Eisenbergiella merdigallinarum]